MTCLLVTDTSICNGLITTEIPSSLHYMQSPMFMIYTRDHFRDGTKTNRLIHAMAGLCYVYDKNDHFFDDK